MLAAGLAETLRELLINYVGGNLPFPIAVTLGTAWLSWWITRRFAWPLLDHSRRKGIVLLLVYVLAFGFGGAATVGATWVSQYQHRSQSTEKSKPLTAEEIAAEVSKRLPPPSPSVNVVVQASTGPTHDADWLRRRAEVETRLLLFVREGEKAHNALYSAQDKQHVDAALEQIEKWRTTFGDYCEQQPSLRKRECRTKILSKTSDRITEPLTRIRTMLNELDKWVD